MFVVCRELYTMIDITNEPVTIGGESRVANQIAGLVPPHPSHTTVEDPPVGGALERTGTNASMLQSSRLLSVRLKGGHGPAPPRPRPPHTLAPAPASSG